MNRYPNPPKNEQESTFPLPEPLFAREILEPLYRQYIRDHPPYDRTQREIEGFFEFLLIQCKPEKYGIKK